MRTHKGAKMKLHLSIGEIALKSLTVAELKNAEKMTNNEYRKLLIRLYGLTEKTVDAMPAREWMLLAKATASYSMGLPLAEIKNSYAGEDGPSTPAAAPTAPIAGA